MNSQTMNSHPMTTRAKSRKIIAERQTRMVEYTLRTFNLFKMRIFSMVSAMIMGYALFVLRMPILVKILNACYLTSALIIMKNVDKEYYCETDVDNQIFMWLIKNIFGKKVTIIEEEEEEIREVEDEDEDDENEDEDEEDDDDEDYIPGEDEDPYRKRRVRKLPVTEDDFVSGECDKTEEFVAREYDEAEDVEGTDDDEDENEDLDEDYVPGEDENPYHKRSGTKKRSETNNKSKTVCVENIAKQTDVDEQADVIEQTDVVEQAPEEVANIRSVSDDYVLAEV